MKRPLRILHVITSLSTGGAQVALYRLLSRWDRARFDSEVVSLTSVGRVGEDIAALGIRVHALGMRRGLPEPVSLLRLTRLLRQRAPDVVQTWMYHADLMGGLAARIAGRLPLAWGIRQSDLRPGASKRTTIWTAKLCARLSRSLPRSIVCGSDAAREVHVRLGYDAAKMIVIPNGYDTRTLKPMPGARVDVRAELGLPRDAPLVGLVARLDPQKDHAGFLRAASHLAASDPAVHFILCGDGLVPENPSITAQVRANGLQGRCHLLGNRDDIVRINSALDVATCCSAYGEGFPNVVAEAMACGTPCVVTDVGDAANIVGDTGKVIPPRQPRRLSDAWREILALEPNARAQQGEAARRRIERCFTLDETASRFGALFEELAAKGTR